MSQQQEKIIINTLSFTNAFAQYFDSAVHYKWDNEVDVHKGAAVLLKVYSLGIAILAKHLASVAVLNTARKPYISPAIASQDYAYKSVQDLESWVQEFHPELESLIDDDTWHQIARADIRVNTDRAGWSSISKDYLDLLMPHPFEFIQLIGTKPQTTLM